MNIATRRTWPIKVGQNLHARMQTFDVVFSTVNDYNEGKTGYNGLIIIMGVGGGSRIEK